MSYSRWSHSCWYTYSDVTRVNDEETLNINGERYPISRLRDEKEKVLAHHRDARFDRNPMNYKGSGEPPADRYTEEEIKELSDIIDYFIYDVTKGPSSVLERLLAEQAESREK